MESDIIKIKHVKGCFCLFFVGGMPGRNKNTCLKLDIDKKIMFIISVIISLIVFDTIYSCDN